jgi:uncharacterized protein
MMIRRNILSGVGLAVILLAFAGCKEEPEAKEYDRTALTANLGGNVILPAYTAFFDEADVLRAVSGDFRAAPSLAALDSIQDAFLQAWTAWKYCSSFEFGPAANVSLRNVLNTFPCDTGQVHGNFTSGTWDFNQAANIDARGFPAVDFMLHGLGADDAAILSRYQSTVDSAQLQAYLQALVTDIHAAAQAVSTQWDGSYLSTFKSSLGTDVGSSTSLLVNELNRDLEVIKHGSIGIPLGKQTFDQPLPEKVEGLYGALSKPLVQAHLAGLEIVFEGQKAGAADRYGLREALAALEAEYNGGSLGDAIHNQFQTAKAALAALPEPLSDAVVGNRAPVETAYNEIQKLVVLLKTDMASALSILITYTDSDGD